MADGISRDEMRDLFKEFFGGDPSKPRKSRDLSEKSVADLQKEVNGLIKGFNDSKSKITKFNDLMKGAQKTVITVDQFNDELKALDEAISKSADTADTVALQEKKRDLQRAVAHNNNIAMVQNFTQELRKVATVGLQGAGTFVKGLQSGGTGIDLAAGLMSTSAEMAGQTSRALGDAMGTAGQTMMASTNPKLKALGAIASVVGPALGAVGEGASKLAKFGIEVLSKEVEKTVKAFHDASSSGALFAGGMTELRATASAAGLTVDQFANVLKANSETISAAGMGVSEGSKRIGMALTAGGTQMKTQLQKLGYGFEEQAGLVADTMAIMRQSGKAALPPEQVAAETQKYAENLRAISAITGEDAKKKMEQVKQQANQLAFQQKLAQLGPEQRAATMRAMANMSDLERKNFMDMVNFGTVINKEGAAAQAMSQGLTDSVSDSYAAFQQGQLDDTKQRQISAARGEAIKQELLGNEAIAAAGAAGVGGLAQALSESMGKELEFRNKFTPEAIAAGESSVEGQKNATDKLTGAVIGAEQAAQSLKMSLQDTLTPAIGQFAEVSKAMLGEVQKMLKDAGIKTGAGQPVQEKGWIGKSVDWLKDSKAISTGLTVGGTAAMIGGAGASATGVGAIAGIPLATIGGVMSGLGMLAGAMGFAKGGVATGPDSGYLTKLHGNELIVPLTDAGGPKPGTQGFDGLMTMMSSIPLIGASGPKPGTEVFDGLTNIMSSLFNAKDTKEPAQTKPESGPTSSSIDSLMNAMLASRESGSTDELLKEQNELLKQALGKYEDMLSAMEDNASMTEKLLHVMN